MNVVTDADSPSPEHGALPSERSVHGPVRPQPLRTASVPNSSSTHLKSGEAAHPKGQDFPPTPPMAGEDVKGAAGVVQQDYFSVKDSRPHVLANVGRKGSFHNERKPDFSKLETLEEASAEIMDVEQRGSQTVQSTTRRMPPRSMPQRSLTEHPQYPNQSHAALQAQVFGPYHKSPFDNRSARSPLSPPISSGVVPGARGFSIGKSEAKTAGSTPAQSPSLFPLHGVMPVSASNSPASSAHGYSSPYLHPVQLQPPRTITTAERNVDLLSGRKMINHYEILEELGRGVHGKVKLARDLLNGEYVAIKIVQRFSKKRRLGKESSLEDKVKKEIAILKKAQHPNVVRMIEVIDDPEINKVYIVLEFCELKEVIWRSPGNSEIMLLEHRRIESHGRVDTAEFAAFNDAVLRLGTRRREKQKMRRRHRRAKSESGTFWSLEYAGDTDEDAQEFVDANSSFHNLAVAQDVLGSSLATPTKTMQSITLTTGKVREVQRPSTSPGEAAEITAETEFGTLPPLDDAAPMPGVPERLYRTNSNEWAAIPHYDAFTRGRQNSSASLSSVITEIMEQEVPKEHRYVPSMTIDECRAAFRDALLGLDYLHYHGIIHRDIKPANLLRTRDHRVKISDFGVSYLGKPIREGDDSADVSESEAKELEDEAELAKTVGTPAFYAPELCSLDFDSQTPAVTGKIDVWALGVTLYCLLFARTPFMAENEFVLMKKIAEEDIYIPRSRLRADDTRPNSRSSSRGPLYQAKPNRRLSHEFLHEEIDDDLHDLLKRLFLKDPVQRISLREVKHHPWVLQDIPNPAAWQSHADPARLDQGKKIEVSKEDVSEAVAPLRVIERIKSITGKAASRVFGGLGGRKRTESTTSSDNGSSSSAHLPSEQKVRENRRASLRPDETLFLASRSSKEPEHPLSRSVTTSPDRNSNRQEALDSLETSETISGASGLSSQATRPSMPDRKASELSTSASIRTIRQSDIPRGRRRSSSPPLPELTPATNPASEHTGHSLSSIFGGNGMNLIRKMRSRDRSRASAKDTSSSSNTYQEYNSAYEHFFGDPVAGVTNTNVSGHVEAPSSARNRSAGGSSYGSRSSSRKASAARLDLLGFFTDRTTRRSTPSHTDSPSRQTKSPTEAERNQLHSSPEQPPISQSYSEETFRHALSPLVTRRALQEELDREQSDASRPSSSLDRTACPPSPADESSILADIPRSRATSSAQSTVQQPAHAFAKPPTSRAISSTSSEEPWTSSISQSTSFPSMPSVVSATSSNAFEDVSKAHYTPEDVSGLPVDSEAMAPQISHPRPTGAGGGPESELDDGYVGDSDGNGNSSAFAIETDEDDSDSEEDFIMMNKQKRRSRDTDTRESGPKAGTQPRRKSRLSSRRPSQISRPSTGNKLSPDAGALRSG